MVRKICGIGINDANYKVTKNITVNGRQKRVWTCPFYRKWTDMINRCYRARFIERNPTYKDCVVCTQWLRFSNFKAWMEEQDWEGKELDKDLLSPDSGIYSPETACFISKIVNMFMVERDSLRGEFPIGVSWSKIGKKFRSECSNPVTGKSEHLGMFESCEDAHKAWLGKKKEFATMLAQMEKDVRIANALVNRYKEYS